MLQGHPGGAWVRRADGRDGVQRGGEGATGGAAAEEQRRGEGQEGQGGQGGEVRVVDRGRADRRARLLREPAVPRHHRERRERDGAAADPGRGAGGDGAPGPRARPVAERAVLSPGRRSWLDGVRPADGAEVRHEEGDEDDGKRQEEGHDDGRGGVLRLRQDDQGRALHDYREEEGGRVLRDQEVPRAGEAGGGGHGAVRRRPHQHHHNGVCAGRVAPYERCVRRRRQGGKGDWSPDRAFVRGVGRVFRQKEEEPQAGGPDDRRHADEARHLRSHFHQERERT